MIINKNKIMNIYINMKKEKKERLYNKIIIKKKVSAILGEKYIL